MERFTKFTALFPQVCQIALGMDFMVLLVWAIQRLHAAIQFGDAQAFLAYFAALPSNCMVNFIPVNFAPLVFLVAEKISFSLLVKLGFALTCLALLGHIHEILCSLIERKSLEKAHDSSIPGAANSNGNAECFTATEI